MTVDPRSTRWPIAGATTWAGFVALSALPQFRLSLIDLILISGPLIVVPLARPLIAEVWFPPEPVLYLAALFFAIAFVNATVGAGGPVLASPWLIVAATVAVRDALRILADLPTTLVDLARLAATAFLVVGAFFAVATRAGWIVAGIHEPIVELTSVHFHFAGFATVVLATCVARALPQRGRPTTPVLLLVCAAPPVVAAGFTWELAAFQIGGAVMMTAATWSVAAITVIGIAPNARAPGRAFLIVSSVAVVAPMVLAVFWAASLYYDVPALSIQAMANVHGTLNAFGFVMCGLIGWRLGSLQTSAGSMPDARRP